MFASKIFFLAALVATAVAAPGPRVTAAAVSNVDKLTVIKTEETDLPGGTITFYGGSVSAAPAGALDARACGTNDVGCSGINVPDATSCLNLLSWIDANGSTRFDTVVRALCQSTAGRQCCVRWADSVPGLAVSDLHDAALTTYNACVVQGQSGSTRNTQLERVCTTQCLSSSPDACA